MTSLFPTYKTSASIAKLSTTENESIALNVVFTITFPPKYLPSPYLTLTFFTIFQIPDLYARHFPTAEALAAVSTTASTSSTARCKLTVKRGMYWGARTTTSNILLIRFPNPLLNQALWSWIVTYRIFSLSGPVPVFNCLSRKVFSLVMVSCNTVFGDCFFNTSCTFPLFSVYTILP